MLTPKVNANSNLSTLTLTPEPNACPNATPNVNRNTNANRSLNLSPKGKVWKVVEKVKKRKGKSPR